MKYLLNGTEWEPTRADGAEVTRGSDRLFVRTKEGTFSALAVRAGGKTYVSYRGRTYKIERLRRARGGHEHGGDGEARAPMPGQIVEVTCQVGDEVAAGDRLMVLEAMKMQQPITAPTAGRVSSLHVSKGDQVADGQPLAVVEEAAE